MLLQNTVPVHFEALPTTAGAHEILTSVDPVFFVNIQNLLQAHKTSVLNVQ